MSTSLVSRRRVLVGTVLVGGSLAAGGVLWLREPAPSFRVFSEREVEVAQAIGEALFPPDNPIGVSASQIDLVREVDRLLDEFLLPAPAAGFRYLLRALEYAAVLQTGSRLSACSLEERLELVEAAAEVRALPVRLAQDALKAVFGMAYMVHPEVLAAIGWRSRCHDMVERARRAGELGDA